MQTRSQSHVTESFNEVLPDKVIRTLITVEEENEEENEENRMNNKYLTDNDSDDDNDDDGDYDDNDDNDDFDDFDYMNESKNNEKQKEQQEEEDQANDLSSGTKENRNIDTKYVPMELFNNFYEDYIEYKHYMNDLLLVLKKNSNPTMNKEKSTKIKENIDDKIKFLEKKIFNLEEENQKLKQRSEKQLNIIEFLSTNSQAVQTKQLSKESMHFQPQHDLEVPRKQPGLQTDQTNKKDRRYDLQIPLPPPPPVVVPGNTSYANIVKRGRNIAVIGDSMISRIKKKEFNDLVNGNVMLKPYLGSNSKDMLSFVVPTLDRKNVDSILIAVGTNDIPDKYNTALNIANTIIEVGKKCKKEGVRDVIISSIVRRNSYKLQMKVMEVNHILKDLCFCNGFRFIDNDIICGFDVSGDLLHLNNSGIRKLANNFIYALNNLSSNTYH